MQPPDTPRKGRGAISNPALRYSATRVDACRRRLGRGARRAAAARNDRARGSRAHDHLAQRLARTSASPSRSIPIGAANMDVFTAVRGHTDLMADGRTRALSDLREGDAIYGTERRGWYRRYVKTRVLAHWSVIKPAFRVTLEDRHEPRRGRRSSVSDRAWLEVRVGIEGRAASPPDDRQQADGHGRFRGHGSGDARLSSRLPLRNDSRRRYVGLIPLRAQRPRAR